LSVDVPKQAGIAERRDDSFHPRIQIAERWPPKFNAAVESANQDFRALDAIADLIVSQACEALLRVPMISDKVSGGRYLLQDREIWLAFQLFPQNEENCP
jgi:hypothetical protein